MTVKCLLLGVIMMGIYVSGCSSLVLDLNQEKGSDGTINIIIHTQSENTANINIFIDNVRVGMDELRSLAKTKKKEKKVKPHYQMHGTF